MTRVTLLHKASGFMCAVSAWIFFTTIPIKAVYMVSMFMNCATITLSTVI